ncbi:hypothetical protein K469DRAFT_705909 [Zopfia rhizophila CBS 207.26]|uniref:Uncharacterized protein n=1 Tax=Zopfia rhizophila CBS 207.26 TaxID=1314779 RepID=A0A6A6EUJ0_9PEZI|nr:hypothetical protein K469DRAFT_705909 [Zopfia rhizophila CBS 207.26]
MYPFDTVGVEKTASYFIGCDSFLLADVPCIVVKCVGLRSKFRLRDIATLSGCSLPIAMHQQRDGSTSAEPSAQT